MKEYPLTPYGQLIAEEDVLWNEGYEYEQVLAALVWLAHKYGHVDEVERKHGFTTVRPHNKLLAREIDALLDQVLWSRSANLRFLLRFEHEDEAPLAAKELGKPSLRLYNVDEKLFAHSIGSMDCWVKKCHKYAELLPLCGKQLDSYRRLDYQDGWIRLWHKHMTGDVLVLEVNEQDCYRLWDVNSAACRAQQRRFWPHNNINLSFYTKEGLVRYDSTRWAGFYGPPHEGIVLNRWGQVPVDLSVLHSSFLRLVYDQLLQDKQSFELRLAAYYLKNGVWVDWLRFYADGHHAIQRAFDTDSPFCHALQEWFAAVKDRFPSPIGNIRLVVTVDLILRNNHDLIDFLEEIG